MGEPFIGSESLRSGRLTRHSLRTRHHPMYPDVFLERDAEITAAIRAKACWLWTERRGVIAGYSASAMHGARWIDPAGDAQILHENRHCPPGITVWSDRIADAEICMIAGMKVTTPARTALDIARRYPTNQAVAAVDALCRPTELKTVDVLELAARHKGRRGIRRARTALELVDPGAQSPKETWLRLLLHSAGLPRLTTQILVHNGDYVPLAYIDMGWEDVLVGIEYDGDQHRSDRRQYIKDIKRLEMLEGLGWLIVRVVAEDHPDDIIRRVREALMRRA
ncbi:MAG: endonuclease domain-containing protein [Mycobacterium sp.]